MARERNLPTYRQGHFHASRQRIEEIPGSYRKRPRQLYDVLQGHIPFAPFYPADIVAMQPSPFRQLLLGIPPLLSQGA
jgi:hypothetical protein